MEGQGPQSNQTTTPNPDPTVLTQNAVNALREQMTEWVNIKFENIERELLSRTALMNEKFIGVQQQFAGRDTALAAALAAAAASAAKSELSFDRRIGDITSLISNQTANNDGKINDLKDRVTTIESRGKGMSDGYSWIVAGIGALFGGAGLIAGIIALFAKGP